MDGMDDGVYVSMLAEDLQKKPKIPEKRHERKRKKEQRDREHSNGIMVAMAGQQPHTKGNHRIIKLPRDPNILNVIQTIQRISCSKDELFCSPINAILLTLNLVCVVVMASGGSGNRYERQWCERMKRLN